MEELGAEVTPVILKGYPDLPKRVDWKSNHKPIKILRQNDLKQLNPPDYVINFHWQVNRSKPFTEQLLYEIESNIYEQSFFWDWLKQSEPDKFINISTIKIFSELNQNPISSSADPNPLSPYGIAKVSAEKYFDAFFYKTKTRVVHLRLGSVSAFGEVPSQLLTQLFNSIFHKKRITVNKGHTSNLLHIDEVVDLIINSALLEAKKNYIVVGKEYLNEYISQRFEEIAKGKMNAEYVDLYPDMVDPIFISDRNKLQSTWTRSYSLDSMIEMIIKSNLKSSSTIDTRNQINSFNEIKSI